jgi:Cof subfamily protein (haloacid dehalogenase superfamily)
VEITTIENYKLLIIDIDGTLVGRGGRVNEVDKKAIKAAEAKGIRVVLCTGRVVPACRRILKELKLKGYHIYFDGALVADVAEQDELFVWRIEEGIVKKAVEFSRRNGNYLELYSSEHFFAEKSNWSDVIHKEYFGVTPQRGSFDGIWDRERIIKAEVVVRSEAEVEQYQRFKEEFSGLLHFSVARSPSFPDIEFINITQRRVSKGNATEKLAGYFGIKTTEIIAIGDGSNDIPLFEVAGFSVAMGNAREELKEIADYTTLSVEEGGVGAAIEKFLL